VALIPSNSVVIGNQVGPSPEGTYYQNQGNLGYLIGMVQAWNPDLSQPKIVTMINSSLRRVYDRKTWFFLFLKGQLVAPQATTGGQVSVTLGSNTVTGTGTAWTTALQGQQFRIGYNNPILSISSVNVAAQTLTLELPWGAPSVTSGYFIIQNYFNLGPNIKYLKTMVNMQLGYKFDLHATQDTLNTLDPWRQSQNFPYIAAGMPLDPQGNYLQELYPASWIQQAFPFMAYVQPPNVSNDTDNLPPYMRLDVIADDVIAEALVIGGPKKNQYYDAAESMRKRQRFEGELLRLANADENLYRTEVTKFGEDLPYYQPGGNYYTATHALAAGGGGYDL
jgi:hypothetical protein